MTSNLHNSMSRREAMTSDLSCGAGSSPESACNVVLTGSLLKHFIFPKMKSLMHP